MLRSISSHSSVDRCRCAQISRHHATAQATDCCACCCGRPDYLRTRATAWPELKPWVENDGSQDTMHSLEHADDPCLGSRARLICPTRHVFAAPLTRLVYSCGQVGSCCPDSSGYDSASRLSRHISPSSRLHHRQAQSCNVSHMRGSLTGEFICSLWGPRLGY